MSFSLSGLPPLPKSLSGLLNIAGFHSTYLQSISFGTCVLIFWFQSELIIKDLFVIVAIFNEGLSLHCNLCPGDSPLQPESAQSSPRPPLPRTAPPISSSSLYANVTSNASSLASRARSRDSLSSPHDFEDQRNGRRTSSVSSHGDLRASSANGSRASSVPAERMYMSSAEVRF